MPGDGDAARRRRHLVAHRRRAGRVVGVEGRPRRHVGPQLPGGQRPAGARARAPTDLHLRPRVAPGRRRHRPTRPQGVTDADRAAGRHVAARRPHPRAVLLRDGRPVRQRRPDATTPAASPATGWRTGFDPTDKGFYHGGDIDGHHRKLDYIEGLGTTAIWLTPASRTGPVQGTGDRRQRRLPRLLDHRLHPDRPAPRHQRRARGRSIDEAHARGIKVFFDIITNHTADVIDYAGGQLRLRRQGDRAVLARRTASRSTTATTPATDDFPPLDPATSFPYTPIFRTAEDETVKVPAWLNDPTLLPQPRRHDFAGESSDVRRLLRPRRPVHRAARRRRRDDRDLRGVGRLRHRRVPDRHRQARQRGVLAGVRAGDRGAGGGRPATTTSSRSARSSTPARRSCRATRTEAGLQATLDFGFQAQGHGLRRGRPDRRAARPVRRRRLLHRHRLERLLAADLPRQPRHGPDRAVPRRQRRRRRRAARAATCSRTR